MNIFEKMGAITNELGPIAKNLQVGDERKPTSYKAVGEADVLAAVKPLEAKYRIFSYPYSRDIVDSDTLTVTKTYNKETTETTKFFLRLKTVYRFVDMDKPDDHIDVTTYGDGVDPNDKAPGKAMTYSDKYALLKAYKAVTGDDPDQDGSEDAKITRKNGNTRPVDAPQKTTPPPQQKEDTRKNIICEDCGKAICDEKKRDGSRWPAAEIAEYTKAFSGRCLCLACGKKAYKEAQTA